MEALTFLAALQEPRSLSLKIAAPYTLISDLRDAVTGRNIEIGAQNMNEYSSGAYTGEISLVMLKDVGAQFVILGHSERRILFGEDDERIRAKVERAVVEGFPIILCVGEKEDEKGQTYEVLERQLSSALEDLSPEHLEKVTIAYEPVWAIGTGEAATPTEVNKIHREIQDLLLEKFAITLPILYGGSVSPENIGDFVRQQYVAGALVGGASLDSQKMNQMIQRLEV